ncbi:MAG: hypothetical protein Q8P18_15490 [Pseudomonadota bacterium]|nr:hypothetical protein [Pseudomonadota bacterium]
MMFLLLVACLDHTPAPGAGESFVAMQADFSGYTSWDAVSIDAAGDGDSGLSGHPEGERTVYVNTLPPADAVTFPVGTVIVKSIGGADIHAMVKRGEGFNTDGAVGWEWFELVLATDGEPVIKWRGEAPPAGETYGSLPGEPVDSGDALTGDCNVCHAARSENDFVHAVSLGE